MSNRNTQGCAHEQVVHLDFSNRQKNKERDRRLTEADDRLREDPTINETRYRIADSEAARARICDKEGNKHFIGALAIATATVALDLGMGELFEMQQFLQGEDVKKWPERIAHGAILITGGLPSAVKVIKALNKWLDADSYRQSELRYRR